MTDEKEQLDVQVFIRRRNYTWNKANEGIDAGREAMAKLH